MLMELPTPVSKSRRGKPEPQIPPLRFAAVGMTKKMRGTKDMVLTNC